MFCGKCDEKMRPHELADNMQLHSCPRCGRTEIIDTFDPHNSSHETYSSRFLSSLHFDTCSILRYQQPDHREYAMQDITLYAKN